MGKSKMDNPEKLVTYDTQDEDKPKQRTQHNMYWTSLSATKHK